MPYVVKQKGDRWDVVEVPGNFVYDTFDTKEEAEDAIKDLEMEDKITDAADDLMSDAIDELCEKFDIDEKEARKFLRDSLLGL